MYSQCLNKHFITWKFMQAQVKNQHHSLSLSHPMLPPAQVNIQRMRTYQSIRSHQNPIYWNWSTCDYPITSPPHTHLPHPPAQQFYLIMGELSLVLPSTVPVHLSAPIHRRRPIPARARTWSDQARALQVHYRFIVEFGKVCCVMDGTNQQSTIERWGAPRFWWLTQQSTNMIWSSSRSSSPL